MRASLYAFVVLAVLAIGYGTARAGHSVPEAPKSASAAPSADNDSKSSNVARRNDSDDDDDDDDETDVARVRNDQPQLETRIERYLSSV